VLSLSLSPSLSLSLSLSLSFLLVACFTVATPIQLVAVPLDEDDPEAWGILSATMLDSAKDGHLPRDTKYATVPLIKLRRHAVSLADTNAAADFIWDAGCVYPRLMIS